MTNGALRATANSSSDFVLGLNMLHPPMAKAGRRMRGRALRMIDSLLGRLWLGQESAQQQNDDANANRCIGDIKDQKGAPVPEMQIGEVDDIAEAHPIEDISE